MAFSGGIFSRLYSWVNDKNNGLNIDSTRMDNEMNGMATALSTCVLKDGTQSITANLPMNSFRHTGVGNAVSRSDYAAAGQVQDGGLVWVIAGGTADALTATFSPAIPALVDGIELRLRAASANATTTPTVAINGLTAVTMTKNGGSALAVGDVAGAGHELTLRYDLAANHLELLNPASTVSSPFSDAAAIIKNSSDATKLLKISASGITTGTTRTMTVPDADFTAVGTATTQTLTNKTIAAGSNTISGITETMQTLADNTTGNVSTSAHGYAPKAPNDATKFLDGTGAYSVPATALMTPYAVYSMIMAYSSSTTYLAGDHIAAGTLTPCAATGTATGDTITGTWIPLQKASGFAVQPIMWQRIA